MESEWTNEEELNLLEAMKIKTQDNKDESYLMSMKKFDWSVTESFLLGRTAEQCKAKYKELIKDVGKFRNIYETVQAAIEKKTDKRKYVETLRSFYVKHKTHEKKISVETAEKQFDELSNEERLIYRGVMQSNRAVHMRDDTAYTPKQEKHLDSPSDVKNMLKLLRHREMRLYLNHLNLPAKPNFRLYFWDPHRKNDKLEDLSVEENYMLWAKLPSERKFKFLRDGTKVVDGFKETFSNWYVEQTAFVKALACKMYPDINETTMLESLLSRMRLTSVKVAPDIRGMTFYPEEPVVERCNAKQFYMEEELAKDKAFVDISKAFPKLSQDEQHSLMVRQNFKVLHSKSDLLKYAGSLSHELRKAYFGLRREKYIKIFAMDIFQQSFPHYDYPVYVFAHSLQNDHDANDDVDDSLENFNQAFQRKKKKRVEDVFMLDSSEN